MSTFRTWLLAALLLALPTAFDSRVLAQDEPEEPSEPAQPAEGKTSAEDIKALTALYEAARAGDFKDEAKLKGLEEAAEAFLKHWDGKATTEELALARIYRTRCWLTAQRDEDVLRETGELLAIEGLSAKDRIVIYYYRGQSQVRTGDKDGSETTITELRKLDPDMSNEIRKLFNDRWAPPTIGQPAPDFELGMLKSDGSGQLEKTLKLSDFKGKYVLIDFWASWCQPCKFTMESELAGWFKKWGQDDRIVFVSIGVIMRNDTAVKQAEYIKENGFGWTMLFDALGDAAAAYCVETIPSLFLVDPEGKLMALNADAREKLADVLEKLEKERAPKDGSQ